MPRPNGAGRPHRSPARLASHGARSSAHPGDARIDATRGAMPLLNEVRHALRA